MSKTQLIITAIAAFCIFLLLLAFCDRPEKPSKYNPNHVPLERNSTIHFQEWPPPAVQYGGREAERDFN